MSAANKFTSVIGGVHNQLKEIEMLKQMVANLQAQLQGQGPVTSPAPAALNPMGMIQNMSGMVQNKSNEAAVAAALTGEIMLNRAKAEMKKGTLGTQFMIVTILLTLLLIFFAADTFLYDKDLYTLIRKLYKDDTKYHKNKSLYQRIVNTIMLVLFGLLIAYCLYYFNVACPECKRDIAGCYDDVGYQPNATNFKFPADKKASIKFGWFPINCDYGVYKNFGNLFSNGELKKDPNPTALKPALLFGCCGLSIAMVIISMLKTIASGESTATRKSSDK